MQTISQKLPLVKPKNEKIFLFSSSQETLTLQTETKSYSLSKTPFSAWWLRVNYTKDTYIEADYDAKLWYEQNNPLRYFPPRYFNYTLPEYEILALTRMKLGSCALWLDMGLGKTIITIAYLLDLYDKSQKAKNLFLILCPPTVFATWHQEITKAINTNLQPIDIIFAHGTKRTKVLAELKAKEINKPTFILTSYDTAAIIKNNLCSLPISAIIIDEASEVKYLTAQKTQAIHHIVNTLSVPRFLLSGTPSTTHISGFYSLYELLYPGASGSPSLFHFKQTYEEQAKFFVAELPDKRQAHIFADGLQRWLMKNYPLGSNLSYFDLGYSLSKQPSNPKQLKLLRTYFKQTGVKNLDKLANITSSLAYVLKKEDVLQDLPPKTYVKRYIQLTKEQREAYDSLIDLNRAIINTTPFNFHNMNSPHCKLLQVANGFLMKEDKTEYFKTQPKLQELLKIIEESGSQKIVVWSPLLKQIAQISDILNKQQIQHVIITGEVPATKRIELVNTFWNSLNCKIFLANPDAAGLGLNLQIAHLEVYMANWHKPDKRIQSEDRCHRQGQKNGVTIIDIIANNTLEAAILNSLRKNINIENQILGVEACLTGENSCDS